jgi:hypothetical protein
MNFEKAIDSINVSKDQFETIVNFLDIKLTNTSFEKLTHLFNNLFQGFNGLANSVNLQKRDIEKLGLDFFYLSQDSEYSSEIAFIKKGSDIEKTDISKTLGKDNNISGKQELIEPTNKEFLKSLDSNTKNLSDPKKTTLEASKSASKSPKFSNEQVKLVLSFVKIAQHNFNQKSSYKSPKEFIDKKSLDGINPNRSFKESLENTIKLNLKLFNESLSQALKGRYELFQTRLIEQPPFGIVAFYVKEKERKSFVKTSRKKRKKSLKKQVKYKKENFE